MRRSKRRDRRSSTRGTGGSGEPSGAEDRCSGDATEPDFLGFLARTQVECVPDVEMGVDGCDVGSPGSAYYCMTSGKAVAGCW